MKIIVNGTETEVRAETPATAFDELCYGDAKVATVLNESFVPAAARGGTRLARGDRIRIVTPRQRC
ncbi:sulfur carrier protein ThiS [Paracoccus sp. (in: a-proteobacteria)]|uniref:sulfur carrier protein ThiS n=1 Tax=Paracoccus sp. TaxID=267 RepID=UPI00396C53F5